MDKSTYTRTMENFIFQAIKNNSYGTLLQSTTLFIIFVKTNIMIEIEKDYFINMEGRVYSKRKFNNLTELKQNKAGHRGYVKVRINRKDKFVHRLVAISYLPNP